MNTDLDKPVETAGLSGMADEANAILAQALGGGENLDDAQQAQPATQVAEGSTTEETDPEAKQAEGTEEQAGGAKESQEGDQEVKTLTELAEALEVDPSFLYGLKFTLADNGGEMTLGELKDQVQQAEHIRVQQSKIEQEQVEFQRAREQFNQQVQQVQRQVLQAPQEILEAQAEMVALQRAGAHLEANKDEYDPGELALKKQELMTAYQGAQGKYQGAQAKVQQQAQGMAQQRVQEEIRQLVSKVPEWKDRTVLQKDQGDMESLMKDYGFAPGSLNQIDNHRWLLVLRDLQRLKAGVASATQTIRRRQVVPKVLRPGAAQAPGAVQQKKLDATLAAAKSTRNLKQKAAAVNDILASLR